MAKNSNLRFLIVKAHIGRSGGRSTPHQVSIDALNTATPNLADLPADLPSHQASIDALNSTTPNLADLLADLPPSVNRA